MAAISTKQLIAARKAFQAVEPTLRSNIAEATETTVYAVERRATQNVAADTGTLRSFIGATFSKRTGFGKVGIKRGRVAIAGRGGSALTKHGARVLEPQKYGPLVEFGTSKMAAQPFMIPAAEAERSNYASRINQAGRRAEQALSGIGGRFL